MARLDKSRSYGTVMGASKHLYEQDGKRFDAQGDEVREGKPTSTPPSPSDAVPSAPLHLMGTKEGNLALDGMDQPALHKLAADSGLKLNVNLGAKKIMAALVKAFPPAAASVDQVDQQLAG